MHREPEEFPSYTFTKWQANIYVEKVFTIDWMLREREQEEDDNKKVSWQTSKDLSHLHFIFSFLNNYLISHDDDDDKKKLSN